MNGDIGWLRPLLADVTQEATGANQKVEEARRKAGWPAGGKEGRKESCAGKFSLTCRLVAKSCYL